MEIHAEEGPCAESPTSELLRPSPPSSERPIGIASAPATMPRNLSRLKFRAPRPPKPLNVSRIPLHNRLAVAREVRNHVLQLSKPAALGLQVVVNPSWKDLPGKKTKKLAFKPHTLRDVVDPEAKAKHGQIIYIFRNSRTNQVIYSLAELLDVRRQLH